MTAVDQLRSAVLDAIRARSHKETNMGHLRKVRAIRELSSDVVEDGDAGDAVHAILGALESLVESHEIVPHWGGSYTLAKRGAA